MGRGLRLRPNFRTQFAHYRFYFINLIFVYILLTEEKRREEGREEKERGERREERREKREERREKREERREKREEREERREKREERREKRILISEANVFRFCWFTSLIYTPPRFSKICAIS